jgi:hypothetical protein
MTGAIKRMFKAAAKTLGARDDEEEPKTRKRKGGEKESGAPIHHRATLDFRTRIAACGRYAGLRSIRRTTARLLRKFSTAADDAGLPEGTDTQEFPSNTLNWLNHWSQDNAAIGHGLDDQLDTQQNQSSPHL